MGGCSIRNARLLHTRGGDSHARKDRPRRTNARTDTSVNGCVDAIYGVAFIHLWILTVWPWGDDQPAQGKCDFEGQVQLAARVLSDGGDPDYSIFDTPLNHRWDSLSARRCEMSICLHVLTLSLSVFYTLRIWPEEKSSLFELIAADGTTVMEVMSPIFPRIFLRGCRALSCMFCPFPHITWRFSGSRR